MNAIKILCTTAIASLMLIALTVPSPAIAESTALCSQTPEGGFDFPGGEYLYEETCPSEHRVTHVHQATLEVAAANLLTSIVNISCGVLFLGEATESLGSPLEISGNFTYSKCETSSGSGCTVTEVSSGSNINVLKEGHETASVTGGGEVTVKCGFLINCTYNGSGLKGVAKGWWLTYEAGYENGRVSIEEQTLNKVAGFLCPKTAKLDITTTPLVRMFIGS